MSKRKVADNNEVNKTRDLSVFRSQWISLRALDDMIHVKSSIAASVLGNGIMTRWVFAKKKRLRSIFVNGFRLYTIWANYYWKLLRRAQKNRMFETIEGIEQLPTTPPTGFKEEVWMAYIATVSQVGIFHAVKPYPEHPFWMNVIGRCRICKILMDYGDICEACE